MSTVVEFQSGARPDHKARFIQDLQQRSLPFLEGCHDFIQWLFPIPEWSAVNPEAPALQFSDAQAIRNDPDLRTALLSSLDTMCCLYGITRTDNLFLRTANFPGPYLRWLEENDHNHLRLTRILRCLTLCGLEDTARGLLALLEDIADTQAAGHWHLALRYWRAAGQQPSDWPDDL